MNHISLYYFTVAAEELNITRAAAKLFISQQSLSEHIRKLEKQYDAVFFTRGGRLALTSQGERMRRYAREVLEADRDLHVALRDAGEANRIRLRIGVTSNRAAVFFPAILVLHYIIPWDITIAYFVLMAIMGIMFLAKVRIPKAGMKGILVMVAIGLAEFIFLAGLWLKWWTT